MPGVLGRIKVPCAFIQRPHHQHPPTPWLLPLFIFHPLSLYDIITPHTHACKCAHTHTHTRAQTRTHTPQNNSWPCIVGSSACSGIFTIRTYTINLLPHPSISLLSPHPSTHRSIHLFICLCLHPSIHIYPPVCLAKSIQNSLYVLC